MLLLFPDFAQADITDYVSIGCDVPLSYSKVIFFLYVNPLTYPITQKICVYVYQVFPVCRYVTCIVPFIQAKWSSTYSTASHISCSDCFHICLMVAHVFLKFIVCPVTGQCCARFMCCALSLLTRCSHFFFFCDSPVCE